MSPEDQKYFDRQFGRLTRLMLAVVNMEGAAIMTVDELIPKVQQNTDTEQSAVLLLGQLGDLIRATAGDPAKVQALADQIDAKKAELAAAVVANTPQA